jgi:hypothetical protein
MAGGEFLGRGWAFDLSEGRGVAPGPDGRVAGAGGEEKIRQSIWLILSTAPGERPTPVVKLHTVPPAARSAIVLATTRQ